MDYYTLEIPIPVVEPVYWLAGLGFLILVISWLVGNWPYKAQLDRLPTFNDRFGANAIAYLAVLFVPIWIVLVILTLSSIYRLGFFPPPSEQNDVLANRIHYLALVGMMGALAALLGTPLALYRVFTTERQTKAAEEGLITDRINKAVEGLGAVRSVAQIGRRIRYLTNDPAPNSPHELFEWQDDPVDIAALNANQEPEFGNWSEYQRTEPNLEVRVGAIYALERIANTELSEHLKVLEILSMYVRNNAPVSNLEPSNPPFERPRPRIDIQTAITVIGRRKLEQKELERNIKFRIDLRDCDLSGCDFSNGDFTAAIFVGSRIEASIFRNAILDGAWFHRCLLNYSDLATSKLRGTRFDNATYNQGDAFAIPRLKKEGDCIFINGADFSAVSKYINLVRTFGTRDSLLEHMDFDFNKLGTHTLALRVGRPNVKEDELEDAEKWLSQVSYRFWSPYFVDDLANGEYEKEFREFHSLFDWPHVTK